MTLYSHLLFIASSKIGELPSFTREETLLIVVALLAVVAILILGFLAWQLHHYAHKKESLAELNRIFKTNSLITLFTAITGIVFGSLFFGYWYYRYRQHHQAPQQEELIMVGALLTFGILPFTLFKVYNKVKNNSQTQTKKRSHSRKP